MGVTICSQEIDQFLRGKDQKKNQKLKKNCDGGADIV